MNLRKNQPADGVVDEAVEAGSRKRLFVAGGVAAALAVVAAMSYVVLTGGDAADETSGVVAAAKRTAAPAPSAQPSATAKATAPAIKQFTGKNARDPFKALVVEQAASTGGSGSTSDSSSTDAKGSTSGTADTTTTVGGGSGSDTPKSASPVTITLVSVVSNDTAATFKLDSKSYKGVKPLETFGTYFKLLNLREGKCGAVQYGDVTFDMCKGDSLTLR